MAGAGSLRLANRLVGNPESAAGLELTLGRAVFRFLGEAWVAPVAGLRSYVAVRGGIDVTPLLGSRSADLRSGLGPAPLRAGDRLPVGPTAGPPPGATAMGPGARAMPVPGEPAEVRVIPGPRDDWFGPGALEVLCGSSYTVTAASDRTGLRLDGPALPRRRDDELPSEGVVTGALQIPPGGQPILLLADHPVTGGYPVIAVLVAEDVGLAAQLRPGSRLRFTLSRSALSPG